MNPAKFAGLHCLPRPRVATVEAALETDLHRHRAGGDTIHHRAGARHIRRHGFFTENRHSGVKPAVDERRMRAGAGGDHDRVDAVAEELVDRVGGRHAKLARQLAGPGRVHVGHHDRVDLGVRMQRVGVKATDPAGPYQSDSHP